MDKKMNKDLGNTGGNLDNQGVRSNIGKKTDDTSFKRNLDKGVDNQDINR